MFKLSADQRFSPALAAAVILLSLAALSVAAPLPLPRFLPSPRPLKLKYPQHRSPPTPRNPMTKRPPSSKSASTWLETPFIFPPTTCWPRKSAARP